MEVAIALASNTLMQPVGWKSRLTGWQQLDERIETGHANRPAQWQLRIRSFACVCGTSIFLHKRVGYCLLGTLIQPDSFGALSHENN